MEQEFLSQSAFRLVGLGVTVLLIYLYFSWQAKKQKKPTKKISPSESVAKISTTTGFAKTFWIFFYFAVGFLLIAGGFYIWQNSAGHPVSYFIGGLILGLIVCYEGYTVIHPPKK